MSMELKVDAMASDYINAARRWCRRQQLAEFMRAERQGGGALGATGTPA